jgi:hypothetical protein
MLSDLLWRDTDDCVAMRRSEQASTGASQKRARKGLRYEASWCGRQPASFRGSVIRGEFVNERVRLTVLVAGAAIDILAVLQYLVTVGRFFSTAASSTGTIERGNDAMHRGSLSNRVEPGGRWGINRRSAIDAIW